MLKKSMTFTFEDFEPPEASLRSHAHSKRNSFFHFQNFEPPEASLHAHACSKNLGPVMVQDFEPPEASLRGHACSKNHGLSCWQNSYFSFVFPGVAWEVLFPKDVQVFARFKSELGLETAYLSL